MINPGPFAALELSSLASGDGSAGFVLTGIDTNDYSGHSVSSAGDVNGDGIDDLVIGAPFADPKGSSSGETYIVFGKTGIGAGGSFALSSIALGNGIPGFVVNGESAGLSGVSVSSLGDVNGDSVDDLLIGSQGASPNANYSGESYVIFGGSGVSGNGTINVSSLNGSNGFVLNGINESDRSGASVSGAGDVNGDGINDLIIGADLADPNGSLSGESYVVFGGSNIGSSGSFNLSSLATGNGSDGFVLNGVDAGDRSGISVSNAGDINGDNVDDLIIGAPFGDPNGSDSGESYVVFGGSNIGSGGAFNLSSLATGNGSTGFVLNGINQPDGAGRSVSSAGDVNGDGVADLIIGAPQADPNGSPSGQTYVVFGGTGVGAGGHIDLSSLNGSTGFALNGIDAGDSSGSSVSGAGDVNGDGIDDLIIGAIAGDPNGREGAGETYVVFGKNTTGSNPNFSTTFNLSSINGANGFVLNGVDQNDHSGASVSSAGDVNGDGVADLIIGAPQADPQANNSGESYVVFGKVTQDVTPNIAENQTSVMTVTSSDVDANDTKTFSISGGADQALFTINANTGALSFVNAPNFELPGDNGANNVYDVQVTVTDSGGLTGSQNIAVTVDNVIEPNVAQAGPTLAGQKVASFDGAGDAISFTDTAVHEAGTADLTVEAWFFWPGTNSGQKSIVAKGDFFGDEGWGLRLVDDAISLFADSNGGGTADADLALQTKSLSGLTAGWHHVAMVLDSTGSSTALTGYLNGSTSGFTPGGGGGDTDGSLTLDGDGIAGSLGLAIGAPSDLSGAFFNQYIDEVRIWSTARSAAEINANINKSLNGNEAGLQGLWKLDGNGADATANSANGTLQGDTTFIVQDTGTVGSGGGTVTFLNLAADVNGDAITYSADAPVNGTVAQSDAFDNHPQFTYTHDGGSSSTGSYQITANDGTASTLQTVSVTVGT